MTSSTLVSGSARADGHKDLEDWFPGRWSPRRAIQDDLRAVVQAVSDATEAAGWWTPGEGQTVDAGLVVFAGVDYAGILAEAEKEADVILWDGGNNDLPFVRPELHIVLLDPHRTGHARRFYPSEAQVRMADVLLIAKSKTARPEDVEAERRLAHELNPKAQVIAVASKLITG